MGLRRLRGRAANAFYLWQYRNIVAVAFDRDFATVSGLPVRFVSYAMTVLVAVCIVLAIRRLEL